MRKLLELTENLKLKTKNFKLKTFVLCSLFFILCSASLGLVHAQEAVEIPGPDLEDASFIQVKDLNIGDVVFVKSETGELVPNTVTKLEYIQEPVEVYNLTVEGEETFFANDFAVHNKSGGDDVKPVCRVIVNPTISGHISGSVTNRSFEIPDTADSQPYRWNGDIKTRDGTPVVCGSACGEQFARASGDGWQNVPDDSVKSWARFLYKITVYGRASDAGPAIIFEGEDALKRKAYTTICDGTHTCGWRQRSLLTWVKNGVDHTLTLTNGGAGTADFDLVEVRELEGLADGATVDDLDVQLYVAFRDNRIVTQLRHWNSGQGAPAWDSENDPNVITFGPNVPESSNPIAHTLRPGGGDSKTVNVQVKDWAGNVSDTCTATVTYTPPTGTITGNVYQNLDGNCEGQDAVSGDWSVTCAGINAKKEGSQFTCCRDWNGGVCNEELSYDPTNGTSYVISVTPPTNYKKTTCSNQWAEGASEITTSVLLKGASATAQNLYLWQGAQAWFQTKEGDVHAQGGGINSSIFPEDTYFCLADTGNFPGVVSYKPEAESDFGQSPVSEKGWLAEDSFSINYSFDQLYSKLGSPEADDLGTDTLERYVDDHPGQEIFYLDGKTTINSQWDFPDGRKIIVFVNGDLEINKEIIGVPSGSFLAFIVKGNINIKGALGDKKKVLTTVLEGVYLADGLIDTNYDDDNSGKRFVAEGIFIAHGGFSLGRNLKNDCITNEICNETTPAELFIARPDLFINIPDQLKESYFFEQEVAP
jgi:hypothetical protein